ncbi:MAG: anion permease [Candidatus Marinimicrobia bacterium]|nr:anion permease [Candidatus Neomarinimicrobiota bacterium]MCF7827609.1 anion permease [Candidatus Neomarinimicrobiota bacterium]MCF7881530.1 anion permease [Candidatus Neomarinimicrobiota bacterium]
MSIDILIVFILLVVATVLFVSERVSFDVTALIIMGTLLISGILTVGEGLSGLSNRATVTIACMFVLSEGVRRTGALSIVSDYFSDLGQRNYWMAMLAMMLVIAVISAFINNTAAVAIFIPVVVGVALDMNESPSKLLMPLSFASMFGGVCTLIGTSTNILVGSIAKDHGVEPFSMFEMTPLGIILFAVGFVYLFAGGIRMIPERRSAGDLTSSFEMNPFLTDIVIEPEFEHIGEHLDECALTQDLDLDIIQVFRETGDVSAEGPRGLVRAGDVIRIRGSAKEIDKLIRRNDVSLKPTRDWYDVDLEAGNYALVEAVIAPETGVESTKIGDAQFYERLGAVVLAIRHHGELQQEDLDDVRLSGGDTVLLSMDQERLPEIKQNRSFVVVSEIGLNRYRRSKMPIALIILAGVILTAALNLVPIVTSAVTGCILLILSGCLTNEEAYEAINWEVIFLLAGVLPLGIAMDKTGAAGMLSDFVLNFLGELGPTAVLSGFFLLSMLLTNLISNQATAALLAPIAIQAAYSMDVSVRPFLMAVTFAASLSFITPVGYQTNTLIFGPGQYKFTDFTRVGTPLNILFWIIATFMIPVIWPF